MIDRRKDNIQVLAVEDRRILHLTGTQRKMLWKMASQDHIEKLMKLREYKALPSVVTKAA